MFSLDSFSLKSTRSDSFSLVQSRLVRQDDLGGEHGNEHVDVHGDGRDDVHGGGGRLQGEREFSEVLDDVIGTTRT